MAGDWLKIDHDLPEKPEVLGIVSRTGEAPETVVGRLFKLWRLADRQTLDGIIRHATPASLAAACGGSADFWQAVVDVGWLEVDDQGMTIPDFEEKFGDSAKRRALHARNVASKRTPSAQPAHNCAHDKRTRRAHSGAQTAHQEQEQEQESDTPASAGVSPLPPGLDSGAFRAAWDEWLAYRRERRVKTTPRTIESQLAMLAEWGPEIAVEAIKIAIRSGWQGLFHPREKRNGKPSVAVGAGTKFDPDAAKRDPSHGKW